MKRVAVLLIGLTAFAAFLGFSIVYESPLLLYIASAIPVFVVPFLPDIRRSQLLRPNRRGVEIVRLIGGGGPGWLVVTFPRGTIDWRCKTLFVPFRNVPTVETVSRDDDTALLTVLRHDLRLNRLKSGRIGVCLPNLSARTANLDFTVHEVNRLIIPLADIPMRTRTSPAPVASRNRELHA
jgi:hypothetical protein